MTTPATEQPSPLSKAETAWLMRALWSALQAPNWAEGNRKDLQKLGEALITGKTLKELPNDLLERIFPHLKIVTLHLGAALKARADEMDTPPETNPEQPATPPAQAAPAAAAGETDTPET
jgi:hypothetical protein